MKVSCVVASAGSGRRLGGSRRKPFRLLKGSPILAHTLKTLEAQPLIDEIVLVVKKEDLKFCRSKIVRAYGFRKVNKLIAGGKTRFDSVYNGLKALNSDSEIVIVHDGVRPFLDGREIAKSIRWAKKWGGCIFAVKAAATVKEVDAKGFVRSTPRRETLWLAQTPQVFRRDKIQAAYAKAKKKGLKDFTDDAQVAERFGVRVKVLEGTKRNIKITTGMDLKFAGILAGERSINES